MSNSGERNIKQATFSKFSFTNEAGQSSNQQGMTHLTPATDAMSKTKHQQS